MGDVMGRNDNRLSIVVGLFGRYELLINSFNSLIKELKEIENVDLIFIADGKNWSTVPLYQLLPIIFENSICYANDSASDLPAVIFNKGLELAKGEYVTFVYPGCKNIGCPVDVFLSQNEVEGDIYEFQASLKTGVPVTNQNRYGFLQSLNCYSPLDLIINKKLLKKLGGFNPSKLLQRDFMQELALRLSMNNFFTNLGQRNHETFDFEYYPFHKKFNCGKDLTARYVVRNCRPAFSEDTREKIEQDFLQDLNEGDARRYFALTGTEKENRALKFDNKYKITVIGGYWEYHHNQICFFNYFENLYGDGFCTYKSLLDVLSTESDLEDSDLVIFTRCRSDNSIKLIDFCIQNHIPSTYMIDDNWLSIAKDHPDQGGIFVKGNSNYDNFIEAIGKCDYTWAFNDKLIEDITPYAKSVIKFSISVESRLFKTEAPTQKQHEIIVGFSGSLRYDDRAFQALSNVVKRHKDIRVMLLGFISEKQRQLFDEFSIIEMPFSGYTTYAYNISKIDPDLLLAPLNNKRTDMSKCFNKYIESGILKAASIYSKVEPYTFVVKDGVNGYFVEDESIAGWENKIEDVIAHPNLLKQVQEKAYCDVIENYTVEVLLPEFVKNINQIIEKEKNHD